MKQMAQLLGSRLSTATVLFHAAAAERMGVSVTDAKCRSLLLQHGPMTAGGLARRTGLTTGAVTGVIDRLERARLVRRVDDPSDRRRVVVEVVSNPKRDKEISRLFEPMGTRVLRLASNHDEKDLARIVEFLTKVSEILEEETARLQSRQKQSVRPPLLA